MSQPWSYPLYLIQHGGGYASIVDPDEDEDANQSLVVFASEAEAVDFMQQCGIMGRPRELRNDREFSWLLQSLRAPVTSVLFDPNPLVDDTRRARLHYSVAELLSDVLVVDNSPWDYPVYVIALEEGFVCVEGQGAEGETIEAIGFFASDELVEQYLADSGVSGTGCELEDMDQTRTFLSGIAAEVPAVAWNPTVTDGKAVAKHCFSVETLLEKYLVPTDSEKPEE